MIVCQCLQNKEKEKGRLCKKREIFMLPKGTAVPILDIRHSLARHHYNQSLIRTQALPFPGTSCLYSSTTDPASWYSTLLKCCLSLTASKQGELLLSLSLSLSGIPSSVSVVMGLDASELI